MKEILHMLQFKSVPIDYKDDLDTTEHNIFCRLEEMFRLAKKTKRVSNAHKEFQALVEFVNYYTDAVNYSKPVFQSLFQKLAENQKVELEDVQNLFARSSKRWGQHQEMAFLERTLTPLLDYLIEETGMRQRFTFFIYK